MYCTVGSFVYCGLVGIWQVIITLPSYIQNLAYARSILLFLLFLYMYNECTVHILIQPRTQDLVSTEMRPWV